MSLDEFLHNLHFDIDKISPPDRVIDWEDSPLPYKLYRGLHDFPLSLEVPLKLVKQDVPSKPNHSRMGHFLWYIFGLSQISQSAITTNQEVDLMQSYRRFVPSGGALYPNEVYVYLKLEDLPVGVYHYDVARHRLVLLREGNFDFYINQALGHRIDLSTCFGTVFISTMFWKNFFKYHNFSYRLQGLDTGVLIGQLLEVAKRFGFETGVYFQFLDNAINHLLGLSEKEESVYAVIPLTVEATNWNINQSNRFGNVNSVDLATNLNEIKDNNYYLRSQRIIEYPILTKLNEESFIESTESFSKIKPKRIMIGEGPKVSLPQVKRLEYDLVSVLEKRLSPDMDFTMGKVDQLDLASLLQEATASFEYRNDLDSELKGHQSRISLYGCFHNVEDIPDAAYFYDSVSHSLRQIEPGDHRLTLQYGMSADNVNLIQVPLCFHVAGDKDHYKTSLGLRGYRIQQMEAGMLVQRLLLAASAIGWGGHPLLGFNANISDQTYKMDSQQRTSLIQIPIGPYRPRPWLRGSLRC
ncbi:SagB/ThcOx family dehydrogenase [Bacillus sp. HNG]|uniref:SagB family peptide dehydrogenase n=1 Tax=Bacillus sp. HNG TaxID=2293325 RepID=UPI000E2E71D4|nr:SagB family peptide dehydrogenase [Bacillus sp. HNG]RFB18935.1 SagB/ThcOx family dehydrogenase [Bacillus sp. HNG]